MNFIKIAEAVENVLLEKVATGAISDYHIEILQDDNKIEVWYAQINPIKSITFDLKVNPSKK
jgi:hypothetical protein